MVTATRTEQVLEQVPASIALRDMDELRRNGFTFGSDEYRGVTGVFFRRGEGDGDEFPFVSFRGSTGTEGSLSLIDGIPLIGLYEETQLNDVPYDAIDRIEIVKGPVSALYGRGALYGATNYLTRNPTRDGFGFGLIAGSDGYARGELSFERAAGEGVGLILSGAYEDYDGWHENGGRRIGNVFAKATAAIGDATRLTAYVNANQRESELPNGIPVDAEGRVVETAVGREGFLGYGKPNNDSDGLFAALKLDHAVNDDLSFALTASHRRMEREVFLNFFDPFGTDLSRGVAGYNGFRGDTTQRVNFLEGTLHWRIGRHRITAGIGGERSDIDEDIRWSGQNGFTPECGFTFYLVEVDIATGRVLNADNPCFVVDDPLTRDRFRNTFWGAFVQDEIALGEQWRLTLGARYDRFRRTATYFPIEGVTYGGTLRGDADAVSPKATLSWLPDWGQVYVAYGRGFNSNFGATFEWDPVQYARPESPADDDRQPGARHQGPRLRRSAAVRGRAVPQRTEKPPPGDPQSRCGNRLLPAREPDRLWRLVREQGRGSLGHAAADRAHLARTALYVAGSGVEALRRAVVRRPARLLRQHADRRAQAHRLPAGGTARQRLARLACQLRALRRLPLHHRQPVSGRRLRPAHAGRARAAGELGRAVPRSHRQQRARRGLLLLLRRPRRADLRRAGAAAAVPRRAAGDVLMQIPAICGRRRQDSKQGCRQAQWPMLVAALIAGVPALAQGLPPQQRIQELDRIRVEQARQAPGDTASKDGAPLRETPQSVSTVDARLIEQRRPLSLNEALRDVAGVVPGTFGRRGFDDFLIRGFSQSAYAFRDGLRFDPGFLLEQEPFGLERIDVLKGPASVLYGQAAPGGIVNAVSKRPTADRFGLVEASGGSDQLARLAFDTGGPLGDGEIWRYRLTALGSDRNDPVDFVGAQRDFVAPALSWTPSADTSLTAFALYQHDRFDRVLALPAAGTVLPNPNGCIDPDTFLGEPGRSGIASTQRQLGYAFSHRFGERFTLVQKARHTDYSVDGLNIIAAALGADGRTLPRRGVQLDVDNRVTTLDTRVQAAFGTARIAHEALLGIDVLRFRNDQIQTNATLRAIDVFAPVYGGPIAFTTRASDRLQRLTQTGAYAQWRTKIDERWVLLAGGRYDWARDDIRNDLSGVRSVQRDEAFTGRFGAVYLAPGGFAPYVSYATSFVPVTGNPTREGARLQPEEGRQIEAGLRWNAEGGRIDASLAVFDLVRRNIVSVDPADPRFSVQIGEQTHRGVELEAAVRPVEALDLRLAYAFLDAEITRSTTGNQGLRPNNVPEHGASVWATLFAAPLGGSDAEFALGARYVGDRIGASATTVLPGYAVLDATAATRVGPWRLALNLKNLTDRTWYAGGSGANFVAVGEPRSVLMTAGYAW